MAYIHDQRGMLPAGYDEDEQLGQFVDAAIKLTSWIAGLFSFGGKPQTRRGAKLAELAQRRGVEKKAAQGWAREYEKSGGSGAEKIDPWISQLNPPITAAEWEELKAAMVKGGIHPPAGWLPTALRSIIPVVPIRGGPAPLVPGGGAPILAGAAGPLGLVLLGVSVLMFSGKGRRRRR